MSNTIGDIFKVTTFGESHGKIVGCVLDGCPSGIIIKKKHIQIEINKRKPGTSKFVTQRKEEDDIEIVSGIYKNKTTGTPICIIVKNLNAISNDYNNIKNKFRPGHADITYFLKYKIRDFRGGGRASARTTISLVMAGAIAKKILNDFFNIKINCYLRRISKINISVLSNKLKFNKYFLPDTKYKKELENILTDNIKKNDSLGCILSLKINGMFPGLGNPLFDKLDSNLSKSLIELNAVKAIEIGNGLKTYKKHGSEYNDIFFKEGFLKNDSGGFLGGITTGQEININIYFKPTSSIFKSQKTLDKDFNEKKIKIKGRHDPCVGIRAAPIIESISSIIIVDSIMKQKTSNFF